ncbi:MAG: hypothetical protein LBK57_03330 [Clostridiales Family XIII bacterium]|jgi:hypothetical protein|nr:hypothetical protein [Clostridiales Family XIII bacterium]
MEAETKGSINKFVVIAVVLALVVITVLIIVIVRLLNAPEPAPTETRIGGVGTVATIENIESIRSKLNEPVADGYYETRMNVEWTFETWDTPSENAYVANSENNTRTVYFTLSLEETNEIIYTSPDIPVGSQLTNFALDRNPGAGEHSAIATYRLLDDDGNELSNVSVSVTLHILS